MNKINRENMSQVLHGMRRALDKGTMNKHLKEINEALRYICELRRLNANPKLLTEGDITLMLEEAWAMVGRVDRSLDFYKKRCENLQKIQSRMRDPERKWVCDILANGYTEQ